MLVGAIGTVICGVGVSYSSTFELFVVCRFLVGAMSVGGYIIMFTYGTHMKYAIFAFKCRCQGRRKEKGPDRPSLKRAISKQQKDSFSVSSEEIVNNHIYNHPFYYLQLRILYFFAYYCLILCSMTF